MRQQLTGRRRRHWACAPRAAASAHLVDRPRDGRDGRDPEALIHLGSLRVVDARDDALDAEGLARDPGSEDVGVVAGRDRGECVRVLDLRFVERVPVEPRSLDGEPFEIRRQPPERLAIAIDDCDRVTLGLEGAGKPGADPSAADDDDVHGSIQAGRSRLGRIAAISGMGHTAAVEEPQGLPAAPVAPARARPARARRARPHTPSRSAYRLKNRILGPPDGLRATHPGAARQPGRHRRARPRT